MGHGSYEDNKKAVWKGLVILAIITLVEVAFSLFGKGYLGIDQSTFTLYFAGLFLIIFSFYKAYYIIYKFMHMADEVSGLRLSVLLPCLLLVWAIIAFIMEGTSWGERRALIENKNSEQVKEKTSFNDTYFMNTKEINNA